MLLDWTLGYWRFNIELGTVEAIPLIGSQLRAITGGGAINTLTVAHLYTLHSYVLSIGALIRHYSSRRTTVTGERSRLA